MTRLDLVTLLVSDVGSAKRFYTEVLGLEVLKDSGGYVELVSRGVRLALFPRRELARLLDLSDMAGTDPAAPAVLSFEVDKLDRAFDTAVARGAEPLRAPGNAPWGKRVAFLRDPDGNLIELYDAAPEAPL